MADAAKRIVGPSLLNGSATSLYSVPTGTQTIIRSIHVSNTATSSYTFTLMLGGTGIANQFVSAFPVPASGMFDWSGMLVLNANETVYALASSASQLTITICGVEVS